MNPEHEEDRRQPDLFDRLARGVAETAFNLRDRLAGNFWARALGQWDRVREERGGERLYRADAEAYRAVSLGDTTGSDVWWGYDPNTGTYHFVDEEKAPASGLEVERLVRVELGTKTEEAHVKNTLMQEWLSGNLVLNPKRQRGSDLTPNTEISYDEIDAAIARGDKLDALFFARGQYSFDKLWDAKDPPDKDRGIDL